MLTFEQKLQVIESFPELERKNVSLGRVNFHYEGSLTDKKNVVYHLHPNGNGYVYVGQLPGYDTDEKGFVNIRDFDEERLREAVAASIRLLSGHRAAAVQPAAVSAAQEGDAPEKELWTDADNNKLTVFFDEDLWYVYAGDNLDSAFETYEELEEYMQEEGFSKQGE
ncbi:hypothetical protein ACFFK0_24545 [Paenibacillus chartarius]|uniref:Uncharacterized protein n=1 Tax=Paenibacillus chartarius TaxID=747481 RepID=A0ABV6DSG4_9BACL